MRRAFTLIEIVMVVAITGLLAAGTFKALSALYVRSVKSRAVTELSLQTQAVLDQVGRLLYARVPGSVIGYDPADGSFEALDRLTSPKPVLEWLGSAEEAATVRGFSGFVDLNASDPGSDRLFSPDTDGDRIDSVEKKKFDTSDDTYTEDRIRLVFAGSFDTGSVEGDVADAFGWHGGGSERIYAVSIASDGNITLSGSPDFVYEKYYLADTAYAVARGGDIDRNATCLSTLGVEVEKTTLLLFYDYRPWKGESFCADPGGSGAGKATILARDVAGFRAETVNHTIRLGIDVSRPIRGSTPVHLAKQKVVF